MSEAESSDYRDADGLARTFPRGSEDREQAEWLAGMLGKQIRYNYALKSWHVWNGILWAADKTKDAQDRVYDLTRRSISQVALAYAAGKMSDEQWKRATKILRRLLEKSRCESAMDVLATMPDYKTDGSDWDQNPYLLGCVNGVLDLRTGELDEHPSPTCLVSKSTGIIYDPDAKAPRFMEFLDEITSGDAELGFFYLEWFGYSLFGLNDEQRFLILAGLGRNGKGALVTVMRNVFGQYSANAAASLYMKTKWGTARSNEARSDLMALKGSRLAVMSEPEGGQFNEEMLKAHTGGDPIVARPLYGAEISWLPTHTITFLTNKPPAVEDIGPAMQARVMVADFRERYDGEKEDKRLYEKLLAESPGVLAAIVKAGVYWYHTREAGGLRIPKRIVDASAAYITENDPIGRVLEERFSIDRKATARAQEVYDTYVEWHAKTDDDTVLMSMTAFSAALRARGFGKKQVTSGALWLGIRVKSASEIAELNIDD